MLIAAYNNFHQSHKGIVIRWELIQNIYTLEQAIRLSPVILRLYIQERMDRSTLLTGSHFSLNDDLT
jgi:hypothetical protein